MGTVCSYCDDPVELHELNYQDDLSEIRSFSIPRPPREGSDASLPLLTTREVADYLQITPRRVGNLWKSGELKGFWLNPSGRRDLRFRHSDVEAFLETRQLPAGSAAG